VLANLLLGFWVFFSRFMRRFQQRKTKLIQGMMVPGMRTSDKTVNSFLYEAYVFSIAKSWVFFFATMLLASSQSWKRHCGLAVSSAASLYYAYKVRTITRCICTESESAFDSLADFFLCQTEQNVTLDVLFQHVLQLVVLDCPVGLVEAAIRHQNVRGRCSAALRHSSSHMSLIFLELFFCEIMQNQRLHWSSSGGEYHNPPFSVFGFVGRRRRRR
jgi:hypothetical protein